MIPMHTHVGWKSVGNHMMAWDYHIVPMLIGLEDLQGLDGGWHDAGGVFFVSYFGMAGHGWVRMGG